MSHSHNSEERLSAGSTPKCSRIWKQSKFFIIVILSFKRKHVNITTCPIDVHFGRGRSMYVAILDE